MGAEIFQPYLQPPKSVMDYQAEMADAEARRQGNALRALAMQQQVDQRNQAMASQNALRRLAAGWGANTTDDQRIADLQNSGDPTLIGQADTLRKTAIERRKGEAAASKDEADAAKTKDAMTADKYRRNVQQIMALGGPEEAIGGLQQQIQRGEVDPGMGSLLLKSIPRDPAAFGAWKLQMVASLGDPKAMVEMLKPHLQTVDLGGTKVQQAVDPLTGLPRTTSTMQVTQSPDNAATNATSRANNAAQVGAAIRGQNLTDARERAAQAGQVEYQTDANGNLVALPKRIGAGGTIAPIPVMSDGKPMPGTSKLTEDQAKATGWLVQASNAWDNMQKVYATNPAAARPGTADMVASVPGLGTVGNAARSADRQKFVQASGSLSESLLRAATGAGINAWEAQQKVDELTPKWGEPPEVTQQKMDAIPLYIETLKARAGSGAQQAARVLATRGSQPAVAGGAPKVVDFGSLK
jgi:hypothetical protein